MIVIIQCAATKRLHAEQFRTSSGKISANRGTSGEPQCDASCMRNNSASYAPGWSDLVGQYK